MAWYSVLTLFVSWIFIYSVGSSARFHLIEVINGQSPLMGYYAVGPAYDVAFDRVLDKYPRLRGNVARSRIYLSDTESCSPWGGEAVSGQVIQVLTNTTGFVVFASPGKFIWRKRATGNLHWHTVKRICLGCSNEIVVLGDFARGEPPHEKYRYQ